MNDPDRVRRRTMRAAGVGWPILGVLLVCLTVPVLGGDPPANDPFAAARAPALPGAAPSVSDPRTAGDDATVLYKGTAVPGGRVTLRLDAPLDPDTTFRWVQVEGPPVVIDDATKANASLTIPAGADKLGFELILGGKTPPRTVRFTIPVRPPTDGNTGAPRADAGDDQVGLVGHRVTLKGGCHTPSDRVAHRWFQIAGPKADQPVQDRCYYSFTPSVSGIYRFGLVVATLGTESTPAISEPDEVMVTVGEPPTAAGSAASGFVPTAYSSNALDQALRAAGAFANKTTLDQIAGVFDTISERSSLYSSFSELSNEMMRRLDAIIPADPGSRNLWSQSVFGPLTQHTVAELRSVGLELGHPQALQQEFNLAQRTKLQALYSLYAREFRSRSLSR